MKTALTFSCLALLLAVYPHEAKGQMGAVGVSIPSATQPTRSQKELEQALAQNPEDVATLKDLIALNVRIPDNAHIQQAAAYLEQAMKAAPDDPVLLNYADLLGDVDKAIARRETVYADNPKDEANLRALVGLYLRKNTMDRPIELVEILHQSHPEDLAIIDSLARLYVATGKPDEAIALYGPLLTNSDSKLKGQASIGLANLYVQLHRPIEVIKTCRAALEYTVDNAPIRSRLELILGDTYVQVQDLAHAEEAYKQVLKIDPKRMEAYEGYVPTLLIQNKFEEAEGVVTNQVLKADPNYVLGNVWLAQARNGLGKPEEGIKILNTVLARNPQQPEALYVRALVRFQAKQGLDLAAQDVGILIDRGILGNRLIPDVLELRLFYARILHEQGKNSEARDALQLLLKYAPLNHPIRKTSETLLNEWR